MLKSDISKPVHFRPLLVGGVFSSPTANKWRELIFHRAILCPQAVSGVESRTAAHRYPKSTGAAF